MRRLSILTTSVALSGCTSLRKGSQPEAFASAQQSSPSLPVLPLQSVQARGLRGLMGRAQFTRWKSIKKQALRWNRRWFLYAGENYEKIEYWGHEREATENFATYAYDSAKDKLILATGNMDDLPPMDRLSNLKMSFAAIKGTDRYVSLQKTRIALKCLECFADLKRSGRIRSVADLPADHAQEYNEMLEAVVRIGELSSNRFPDAVAAMIRAAEIADYLHDAPGRDDALNRAETAAKDIEREYAFAQPKRKDNTDKLIRQRSYDEYLKMWNNHFPRALELNSEHFRNKPKDGVRLVPVLPGGPFPHKAYENPLLAAENADRVYSPGTPVRDI